MNYSHTWSSAAVMLLANYNVANYLNEHIFFFHFLPFKFVRNLLLKLKKMQKLKSRVAKRNKTSSELLYLPIFALHLAAMRNITHALLLPWQH